MSRYPVSFRGSARCGPGKDAFWQALPWGGEALLMAIPKELGGPGGGLSAEDLYVLSLSSGFVARFKTAAEVTRLLYDELTVEAQITLAEDSNGVPSVGSAHLIARLRGVTDAERARRLLGEVSRSCFILNSLRAAPTFLFEVSP